jgi:ABC-type sugar transport system substrate-binding protein
MRKLAVIGAVLAIATAVAGGVFAAGSGDAASGPLAGKVVWEVDVVKANPALTALAQAVNLEVAKAGGTLVRSFAVNSAGQVDLSLQAQGFDRAIAAKPAAIIWLVIDPKSMRPQVKKAKAAGIPVFALIGKPQGSTVNAIENLKNNAQGYILGKTLAKALKPGDQVSMIESFPTPNTIEEQAGAVKAMKEGGLKIVGDPSKQRNATDIASGAQPIMQGLLARYPDLKGMFVYNDDSAIGAISAIRAAGKRGKITVVSRNGEDPAIAAIKSGDLLATCDINPIALGRGAGAAVVRQLTGKAHYTNNFELPSPSAANCLVTKKNVNSYKSWSKRIHYVKIAER